MTRRLHSRITARGATVEVYFCDGERGPGFQIMSSSGYLAVFPEAHASEDCSRTVCTKPDGHDSYIKTRNHCHGFHHIEQVYALAQEVAKTYGSAERGKTDPSKGWPADPRPNKWGPGRGWTGHRVRRMNTKDWAETEWAKTMEATK
jgi:hypothetical protein